MKDKASMGQSSALIIGIAFALQVVIVAVSLWLLGMFGFNFRHTVSVYGWSSALFMPSILIVPASIALWSGVLALFKPVKSEGSPNRASSMALKVIGLLLSVALGFGVMLVFALWVAGARH